MLDSSTFYLLLAMGGFVFVAVVMVHHHNCANAIRIKKNEFESISQQLEPRIEAFEEQIIDLQVEIDEIDEEIDSLKA